MLTGLAKHHSLFQYEKARASTIQGVFAELERDITFIISTDAYSAMSDGDRKHFLRNRNGRAFEVSNPRSRC